MANTKQTKQTKQLLIINPNTTQSVSDKLDAFAKQDVVGSDIQIRTVTASFGAPYIDSEASYAVAAHATLEAMKVALQNNVDKKTVPHAILIACFGDPGLLALRESTEIPITGLAEAAFMEAASYGRFAIVTGGARWKPMLERHAHMLGFEAALAGIHTVQPSGLQLAQDPAAAKILLAEACKSALRDFDAQAVILGGAGLAGMAASIQAQVDAPVIDSVLAGVRLAVKRIQAL
jgi:allantoin racemase